MLIGSELHGKDITIPTTHNLVSLWRQARLYIESVWSGSETITYLNLVEERLQEMRDIDSSSYTFRYPEDTKGEPSLTGTRYINLKQLMDVIQGISNVLDGASTGMGEHLDSKERLMAEYRAEMRREYGQYNIP